jgi:transposase-like protein
VPRDRASFKPPIHIPKHERRFTGFDAMIIAMDARGRAPREIRSFLLESYVVEVVAPVHQLGHRRCHG